MSRHDLQTSPADAPHNKTGSPGLQFLLPALALCGALTIVIAVAAELSLSTGLIVACMYFGLVAFIARLIRRSVDRDQSSLRAATRKAILDAEAFRCATEDHALVSIADASGKIIDVNNGFCRISGYARSELLGQDHRILNSGIHPKSFWVEMWKTVTAGNTWRAEVCNRQGGPHCT